MPTYIYDRRLSLYDPHVRLQGILVSAM